MPSKLHQLLISAETSILEVIRIIDASSMQIALVHVAGQLLGTVTDGDVRRGLLAGVSVNEPVSRVMNTHPITIGSDASAEEARQVMRDHGIRQLPVLDDVGKVIGLHLLDDNLETTEDTWVVLMAGGLGTRLRPLTEDCPKPLLKVGSRPIMETILHGFIEQGFRRFFVSVNYRGEMIEQYFGDGSRWGAQIEYMRETEPLGTAGALSLLPSQPTSPFFVMNADLLTKVNFRHLLDFHNLRNSVATMSVREYEHTVPYGVICNDGHDLVRIEEKPVQKYFVNAGIYVLSPDVLDSIPQGKPLDMPQLFQNLMDEKRLLSVHPLREYWLDIGQIKDFQRASDEFHSIFN